MSELSFSTTASKVNAYCEKLTEQERWAFKRLYREQRRTLLRGYYRRRLSVAASSEYSLARMVASKGRRSATSWVSITRLPVNKQHAPVVEVVPVPLPRPFVKEGSPVTSVLMQPQHLPEFKDS